MVQITVPKKLAKQFRPLLDEGQESVYIFTNLSAVDTKQRTYIYHHQKYMLQFQPNSKVHRLDSREDKIPHYAFKFCPFDQLSSKDITSKPLLGISKPLPFLVCLKTYLTHSPYRFNRSYQPYRTLWFCQRNIKYKTPKSQDSRPRVYTFIQFTHVW